MTIYDTNISNIINKSFKDVFVYHVLSKSFLKYVFSFETYFFYSYSTRHKITEIALAPSPIASKGRYKRRNEFVDGP